MWDGFDGAPMTPLPPKFRMPDMERYTGRGSPRTHLRIYHAAVGSAPLFSHTDTSTTTAVILWDVSLCLYFLSVIEDTVGFKFRGVCMCGCTGLA